MRNAATRIRQIVRIDRDKCDGCGLCVPACAEGAIRIVDGKAELAAENLCDGLGACLGHCPRGAITIEERPAEQFDPAAVQRHLHHADAHTADAGHASPSSSGPAGCPHAALRVLQPASSTSGPTPVREDQAPSAAPGVGEGGEPSRLTHWPIQLALLPIRGDIWNGADVLLAADCVAFACPDFHRRFVGGKTVAVACPKLDDASAHVDKLAAILAANDVRSVTVAHMEVPCCFGLERIVRAAVERAGKPMPIGRIVLSIRGDVRAVVEPR